MKIFITGGAGFIGSNLVFELIRKKNKVIIYDNFSTGKEIYLEKYSRRKLEIIQGDVLDLKKLKKAMKNHGFVYHFSANADIRRGLLQTDLDLKQGILATYNVLKSMRENKISRIVFPSSMTVYGEARGKISENYGPCFPISLYAASKLSSESLISAFSHSFGMKAWIFRFANVVGGNLTHGVIFDLINKILKNKDKLEVLGDGYQTKPYIHISDAISAMLYIQRKAKNTVNLFNIGADGEVSVREIVEIILEEMKMKKTVVNYQKTPYGWKGDVSHFSLDCARLKKIGFRTKYSGQQALRLAVKERLEELNYKPQ